MRNEALHALCVAINAGYTGGLCARIALHDHGAAVDNERIPGPTETRGVGIAMQPEMTAFLEQSKGMRGRLGSKK
jgi:hypothetical protein